MFPARDNSILPSRVPFFSRVVAPEPSEPKEEPKEPKTPKASPWTDHVKSTYASLKASDPKTTFKEAMTHAKASYKKSRISPRNVLWQ